MYMQELKNLLKLMKLRPATGFGEITIIWRNGEIVDLIKKENIKPKEL